LAVVAPLSQLTHIELVEWLRQEIHALLVDNYREAVKVALHAFTRAKTLIDPVCFCEVEGVAFEGYLHETRQATSHSQGKPAMLLIDKEYIEEENDVEEFVGKYRSELAYSDLLGVYSYCVSGSVVEHELSFDVGYYPS